MDKREEYGREHEQEVLKIFERMVSDFEASSKPAPAPEVPAESAATVEKAPEKPAAMPEKVQESPVSVLETAPAAKEEAEKPALVAENLKASPAPAKKEEAEKPAPAEKAEAEKSEPAEEEIKEAPKTDEPLDFFALRVERDLSEDEDEEPEVVAAPAKEEAEPSFVPAIEKAPEETLEPEQPAAEEAGEPEQPASESVSAATVVVRVSEEKIASKEARAAELAYLEALKHEQQEIVYKEPEGVAPVKTEADAEEDEDDEEPERKGFFAFLRRKRDSDDDDYDEDEDDYDDDDYEDDDYDEYDDYDEDDEEYMERKGGKRKRKKKRHIFWKLVLAIFLLGLMALAVGGVFVARYIYDEVKDLPPIDPTNIYELLAEHSVMYDAQGNFMENIYEGDALRENIAYKDIPENLKYAFICTEDKTFFEHKGFNFVRIAGAVFYKLTGKADKISGTSTITQQLARNIYLPEKMSERSMERKLAEAYYALQIEKALSKEQILEAYLNTIFLGYGSNGISAAAEAYFSKDISELTLVECACLAALPQSPDNTAPIKRISPEDAAGIEGLDIISEDDTWVYYYNDKIEPRIELVLINMHDQGKISDREFAEAMDDPLRERINPGKTVTSRATLSSYFADYTFNCVVEDLMEAYDLSREEARKYIYTRGLRINTTLNPEIQRIMEEEYANLNNFPSIGKYSKDGDGNVLDEAGKVMLYNKELLFDEEENYIIPAEEYEWQANGDLLLFKGGKLNFYRTTYGDTVEYTMEFKGMFETDDIVVNENGDTKTILFSRAGHISVPVKYKDRDDDGNLIISAAFFSEKPDAFVKNEDGSLRVPPKYYNLSQRVMQPQSAMVVIDNHSGAIVGMVGGRGIEGKLLYNRATAPRQPGSAIKPLAVYSVALQAGVEGLGNFTTVTPLDDIPISLSNQPWPKNWYSGYRGMTNLRNAVEQSINACSVNMYMQLPPGMSIEFLENMGVTSLVKDGPVNDINASALALGGMTRGISTLEMTAAFATFVNDGVYTPPAPYTTVTNKRGDVILDRRNPETVRVMDESVAQLMTDILRTVVTNGLASAARLTSQPSAGKTGTTSERYDIWFCGLTPKYSASTWIGNDVNIPLDSGSSAASKLWASIMERVGALDERGSFNMNPAYFVSATVDRCSGKFPGELTDLDPRENIRISDYFIKGTEPTENDDAHMLVPVCRHSGYLATPFCSDVVNKICVIRPGGRSWEAMMVEYQFNKLRLDSVPDAVYDVPEFYCPLHNPDVLTYIISPLYEDGSKLYAGMTYQEIEPEYIYDDWGNIIDIWGNMAVIGEDGRPLRNEDGRMIVYDAVGNHCVADDNGVLHRLDGGEAVTDPFAGMAWKYAPPEDWPPLPPGLVYEVDPATGYVVLDGMSGLPVITEASENPPEEGSEEGAGDESGGNSGENP